MPNLLILGAMRAGTTSAYRYLSAHPDVFMSEIKEPHFLAFDGLRPRFAGPGDEALNSRVITDLDAYASLFSSTGGAAVRGEASAMYLYLPSALRGLQRHCPEVTCLVLLRDPVARAYSAYQYQRMRGREPLESFEEAITAEPQRREAGWAPMWHYASASRYGEQLARLTEVVPRHRLHFVLYEDLVRLGPQVLHPVYQAFNLDPEAGLPPPVAHNRSGDVDNRLLKKLQSATLRRAVKRRLPARLRRQVSRAVRSLDEWQSERIAPPPPMAKPTRHALVERFLDDIMRVEELIGRELPAWR